MKLTCEKENITRWTQNRKNFFEVYYIKWNDLVADQAGWIRYTLLNSEWFPAQASVWGIFIDGKKKQNNVAIKQNYPLSELKYNNNKFYWQVDKSGITTDKAWGDIYNSNHSMCWQLQAVNDKHLSICHIPSLLYKENNPFLTTKFVAPRCWYKISGNVRVDNREIILEQANAHQAHFWGDKQVYAWTWGNCSTFEEDPEFLFEGVVGYNKLAGITFPLVYLFFYWRGKLYCCNHVLGSSIYNRSADNIQKWKFSAIKGKYKFCGEMRSRPQDMIYYVFQDPDGEKRYSHNNFRADLTIDIYCKKRGQWQYIESFNSKKGAAFEMAVPNYNAEVEWGVL